MAACALGATVGAALAQQGGQVQPAAPAGLKTVADKASYAIGVNIGNSITRDDLDINAQALVRGLTDALNGQKPQLSEEEMAAAMQAFQQQAIAKMAEKQSKQAEANAAKGKAFLEANKKQPGVQTTQSGLQYKILKRGTGPSPKATDTVKTHYKGTLLNGETFDSSYDRGEPATFPVNGVIAGWTEALQKMKVGGKWKLFVPAELAYGERGAGGAIGPNETLVFEVELLGIENQGAQQ
jgi:FKBP-type peptidyl-prolyl cis-trans isomerase FklB